MFAALAAGLWFTSRRAGALMLVYVVCVVFLPRVYLGMHYPTDILAGMAIGFLIAWAVNSEPLRPLIAGPLTRWRTFSPGTFYACAFLLTSQIAVLFDPVRDLARYGAHVVSSSFGVPIPEPSDARAKADTAADLTHETLGQ